LGTSPLPVTKTGIDFNKIGTDLARETAKAGIEAGISSVFGGFGGGDGRSSTGKISVGAGGAGKIPSASTSVGRSTAKSPRARTGGQLSKEDSQDIIRQVILRRLQLLEGEARGR
jgi:hypothetical protein